jgi:hypothetical protein
MNEKGEINIIVTGTIFVALALIVVLGLSSGISFNQIGAGLGNPLILVAIIAFIVLVFLAIMR